MKKRARLSDPRFLLFLALVPFAWAMPARAATWIVEHDPDQPEGRIGAAVAQAASGDTILIGPGLYYEHIEVAQTELTLIGRDGAGATVLDGSRPAAPEAGAILYYGTATSGRSLSLQGLTFQQGQGRRIGSSWNTRGGAIYWPGDLHARDCVFRDNRLLTTITTGGAIFVPGVHVLVEDCDFVGNVTHHGGGDVHSAFLSSLEIRRCRFESTEFGSGALLVGGPYDAIALIEDCNFRASGGHDFYTAFFDDVDVVLRGNHFEDVPPNGGGTQIGFGHVYPDGEATDILMEDNEFVGGPAPWVSYINIDQSAPTLTARGNTFHRVRFYSSVLRSLVLERNIFSVSPVDLWASRDIRLLCNAAWPESLEVGPTSIISENYGNLFVDPLLCDPENGDLTLRSNSPCAPNNSPAGCGLIGACEVGCEGVPVEVITWSRIKWWMLDKSNRFRR